MNSAVRAEVVRLYLEGYTAPDLAAQFSVSVATIHAWIPKEKKRGQARMGRTGEFVKGEDLSRVMHDYINLQDHHHMQRAAAGVIGGQKNLGRMRTGGRWNTSIVGVQQEHHTVHVHPFTLMAEKIDLNKSTLDRYYNNMRSEWIEFANADKVLTYLGAHWRFNVDVPVYLFDRGLCLGEV